MPSKSAAQRWGQNRERHLLQHGPPHPKKEVPTLDQFASRFIDGHARANRQKPSGIAAKAMIVRVHLVPMLGAKPLDTITNEDVQRLKHRLLNKAPKTVNNILTVLNVMLKKAVEWDVIDRLPCTIKVLPVSKGSTRFYDFDEFDRLVTAAKKTDPRAHVLVLLAGDAGLRLGEMVALEWRDIDFAKGQVCVQRSAWKGQVASPKGGRLRYVPLTARLAAALREHRYLSAHRSLVAVKGEDVVGVCVLEVRGPEGSLAHVWIAPEHQRCGIGRTLITQVLAMASDVGVARVEVESDPFAEAFYERLGARRLGATPAPMPGAPERTLPLLEFVLAGPHIGAAGRSRRQHA